MNAIQKLKILKLEATREEHPNVPDHALPLPKYSDKKANGLTKCIIDFINLSGGQAERIRSEGRMIDNRKIVTDVVGLQKQIGSVQWIKSTSTNGTADISATVAGRSVKIEVKIGRDKQSDDQKKYQAAVERSGGIYYIAKDFESFYNFYIEKFSNNKTRIEV
ncbi:MAG: hypothetical protein NXI00_12255 [Cytophagales bacterium]|nr:hypothetical protein [Cytophagales bacterium]